MAALFRQPLGQLAGGRGLASTLQPEQENDARMLTGRLKAAGSVAEQRQHLIAYDFDDMLRWRQAAKHVLAHRAVAHAIDERLDDLEAEVRREGREANLQ